MLMLSQPCCSLLFSVHLFVIILSRFSRTFWAIDHGAFAGVCPTFVTTFSVPLAPARCQFRAQAATNCAGLAQEFRSFVRSQLVSDFLQEADREELDWYSARINSYQAASSLIRIEIKINENVEPEARSDGMPHRWSTWVAAGVGSSGRARAESSTSRKSHCQMMLCRGKLVR